jgi:hypothetical protein
LAKLKVYEENGIKGPFIAVKIINIVKRLILIKETSFLYTPSVILLSYSRTTIVYTYHIWKLVFTILVILNNSFPLTPMSGDDENNNKKLINGLELNNKY